MIRFWWEITNYDKEVLDFYNEFYTKEFIWDKYLNTILNDKKESISKEKLFNRKLNFFKWYKCYPFRQTTFINVQPDLESNFVWCRTLYNKKYGLADIIEIFKDKKNEEKFVYCIDDVCDCYSAYGIKKIYDDKILNISNLLTEKLNIYFKNIWIKTAKVEYLKNNLDLDFIELSFKYDEKTIYFVIETKTQTWNYMFENNNLWIHWYTKNNQYEFIKYEFIDNILFNNILEIIKKSFQIFETILLKWKKQ